MSDNDTEPNQMIAEIRDDIGAAIPASNADIHPGPEWYGDIFDRLTEVQRRL